MDGAPACGSTPPYMTIVPIWTGQGLPSISGGWCLVDRA